MRYPNDGTVITGTSGIRKLRWAALGLGKRGGARLIYYFAVSKEKILLLDIYAKNEKSDISKSELKELDEAVAEMIRRI
jgi:hypothetical protein